MVFFIGKGVSLGFAGVLSDFAEGFRLAYREFGKDLAIKLNICCLQACNQLPVCCTILSSGSIDACNPEATQRALSVATVAI